MLRQKASEDLNKWLEARALDAPEAARTITDEELSTLIEAEINASSNEKRT